MKKDVLETILDMCNGLIEELNKPATHDLKINIMNKRIGTIQGICVGAIQMEK